MPGLNSVEIQKIKQEIADQVRQELLREFVPTAPNKNCFTAKEVAQMRNCSVATIISDEKKGILIARFPNAKKKYHRDDVEWYLRGRKPPR